MSAVTHPDTKKQPAQSIFGLSWGSILTEAFIAALVAFLLAVLLIGFRTYSQNSVLTIETRWPQVGIIIALVFIGRVGIGLIAQGALIPAIAMGSAAFLIGLFYLQEGLVQIIVILGGGILVVRGLWGLNQTNNEASMAKSTSRGADWLAAHLHSSHITGPILLVLTFSYPIWGMYLPQPFGGRTGIDLATLIFTYIMLGWGLNIIVGLAGLLDLGYVAFYAVGAYTFALLGTTFDWSFWVCLPLAGLFAAFAGLVLGFPVLRLRGDYFAIVTLGFGEIIRIVLLNWYPVTRGPDGIGNIPRPSFFGFAEFTNNPAAGETAFHTLFNLEFDPVHRIVFLYYLIVILALFVNAVSSRIRNLPIGRSWEALREDDVACQALGINRRNIKLAAFSISAAFGGIAGSFFAARQGFISPESFTFHESAIILAIVVLGGMGSQAGVILAAVVMIGLPEIFRELAEYRMMVFGMSMVLIMIWRPTGLLAHREPSLLLHGKKGWIAHHVAALKQNSASNQKEKE